HFRPGRVGVVQVVCDRAVPDEYDAAAVASDDPRENVAVDSPLIDVHRRAPREAVVRRVDHVEARLGARPESQREHDVRWSGWLDPTGGPAVATRRSSRKTT